MDEISASFGGRQVLHASNIHFVDRPSIFGKSFRLSGFLLLRRATLEHSDGPMDILDHCPRVIRRAYHPCICPRPPWPGFPHEELETVSRQVGVDVGETGSHGNLQFDMGVGHLDVEITSIDRARHVPELRSHF